MAHSRSSASNDWPGFVAVQRSLVGQQIITTIPLIVAMPRPKEWEKSYGPFFDARRGAQQ
jgi:hypothetical protein